MIAIGLGSKEFGAIVTNGPFIEPFGFDSELGEKIGNPFGKNGDNVSPIDSVIGSDGVPISGCSQLMGGITLLGISLGMNLDSFDSIGDRMILIPEILHCRHIFGDLENEIGAGENLCFGTIHGLFLQWLRCY